MDYNLLGELTQLKHDVEACADKVRYDDPKFRLYKLQSKRVYFDLDGSSMELSETTINFLRYQLNAPIIQPPNYAERSSRNLTAHEIIAAIDAYLRKAKIGFITYEETAGTAGTVGTSESPL